MPMTILDWLGPTPADEICAQSGDEGFTEKNKEECRKFKGMLAKACPPPNGCAFVIEASNHDFGTYREVTAQVDEDIAVESEVEVWMDKYTSMPYTWLELEDIAEGRVKQ